MNIRYDGILYRYLGDDRELLTYKESKIDKKFEEDAGIYYRQIPENDPKLQDIYEVKFYIEWDSNLENVIKKWHIETCNYFPEGIVRLCHEGYLPGWKIIEKGLSEIYLKPSKIEGYSVEYIYVVKDGKKLSEPLVIEQKLDMQEFKELIEMYRSTNI